MSNVTEEYKRLNRERYDRPGRSGVAKYHGSPWRRRVSDRIAAWAATRLSAGPDGACLAIDVGGGVGYKDAKIALRAPWVRIVGADLSRGPLQERRAVYSLDWNVQADMEDLPFRASTYDAVLFFGALHHSQYPLRALQEARRVLRPSGTALLVEPVSLRMWISGRGFEACGDGVNFKFSLPFLLAQLPMAGFHVQEVETTRIAVRIVQAVGGPRERLLEVLERLDQIALERLPVIRRLGGMAFIRATAA